MAAGRNRAAGELVAIAGAAYLLPFLIVVLVDQFVLGRSYVTFPNDAVPGMFALGLDWLTLAPLPVFHLPGYTFHQISALLIVAIGMPSDDLDTFNAAGVAIQMLAVLASAWWMGRVTTRLGLAPVWPLLIGMLAAAMPTMMLSSTIWLPYYALGVFAAPVSLEFYAASDPTTASRRGLRGGAFALGAIVANLMLGIVLAVAAALALLYARRQAAEPPGQTASVVAVVGLGSLLASLSGIVAPRVLLEHQILALSCGWLAAALVVAMCRRAAPLRQPLLDIATPAAAGWLLASNALFLRWGESARGSLASKGGAAPHLSFDTILAEAHPLDFLLAWSWHWTIPLIAAIGLAAIWRRPAAARFTGVFAIVALALNLAVAADVSLLSPSSEPANLGLASRYYIMLIGPAAVCLAWAAMASRVVAIAAAMAAMVIAVASSADYLAAVAQIGPVAQAEFAVDRFIDDHLAARPENTVLCANTVLPRRCGVLYAFHNYRTAASAARVADPPGARRIAYAAVGPDCSIDLGAAAQDDGAVLLITECLARDRALPGAEILAYFPIRSLGVFRLVRRAGPSSGGAQRGR